MSNTTDIPNTETNSKWSLARLCRLGRQIGTTTGLAQSGCHENGAPEQVYVFVVEDDDRPIAVEGWVGYSIPQRLHLTRRQARELAPLLIEALADE